MTRTTVCVLLASAAVAAGCSKEGETGAADRNVQDQTPYEQLYTTADTAGSYQSNTQPAAVTPVQGGATKGGPLTATGNFTGTAAGAPAGSVTLTEAGPGGTQVRIKIDRYTAGSQVQAQLTRGTCGSQAQVVAQIGEPIQVESTGFGTLVASIPQPAASILDGQHAVQLTGSGGQGTLACAQLPQLQGQ